MTRKALIIDDEREIGELLSAILRRYGYLTDYQPNLTQGLAAFTEGGHDLVFLDLMLPDGEGYSVIEPIRNLRPTTQIVIISANAGDDWKRRAESMGVKHYLVKPFSSNHIETTLQSAVVSS